MTGVPAEAAAQETWKVPTKAFTSPMATMGAAYGVEEDPDLPPFKQAPTPKSPPPRDGPANSFSLAERLSNSRQLITKVKPKTAASPPAKAAAPASIFVHPSDTGIWPPRTHATGVTQDHKAMPMPKFITTAKAAIATTATAGVSNFVQTQL